MACRDFLHFYRLFSLSPVFPFTWLPTAQSTDGSESVSGEAENSPHLHFSLVPRYPFVTLSQLEDEH